MNNLTEEHFDNTNINELDKYSNLVNVTFNDLEITTNIINYLNSLNSLENVFFNKCTFSEVPKLTKIKGLHLCESKLDNIDFLDNLNNIISLSLEYMNVNNLEVINKLNNLNTMSFTGSILPNIIELSNSSIKELHIDGVILNSIDNLFFPKELKRIYISKIQYLLNPEYFNDLKKYGVEVNYGIDTELIN